MKPERHLRAVPSRDIHALGCACPTCEPYKPSRPRFTAAVTQTCLLLIVGMAIGALLVFATAGIGPTLRAFVGS